MHGAAAFQFALARRLPSASCARLGLGAITRGCTERIRRPRPTVFECCPDIRLACCSLRRNRPYQRTVFLFIRSTTRTKSAPRCAVPVPYRPFRKLSWGRGFIVFQHPGAGHRRCLITRTAFPKLLPRPQTVSMQQFAVG